MMVKIEEIAILVLMARVSRVPTRTGGGPVGDPWEPLWRPKPTASLIS